MLEVIAHQPGDLFKRRSQSLHYSSSPNEFPRHSSSHLSLSSPPRPVANRPQPTQTTISRVLSTTSHNVPRTTSIAPARNRHLPLRKQQKMDFQNYNLSSDAMQGNDDMFSTPYATSYEFASDVQDQVDPFHHSNDLSAPTSLSHRPLTIDTSIASQYGSLGPFNYANPMMHSGASHSMNAAHSTHMSPLNHINHNSNNNNNNTMMTYPAMLPAAPMDFPNAFAQQTRRGTMPNLPYYQSPMQATPRTAMSHSASFIKTEPYSAASDFPSARGSFSSSIPSNAYMSRKNSDSGSSSYSTGCSSNGSFSPSSNKFVIPSVEAKSSPSAVESTEIDDLMSVVQTQQGHTTQIIKGNNQNRPPTQEGPKKRFVCPTEGCDKTFNQKTHLDIHERSHNGDRPYRCEHEGCKQTFSQLGNLKTHARRHTGERPYSCDICGRSFAQRGNVNAHKLTHRKERPYDCKLDDCGKRFTQLGNLKSHQNKFHKAAIAKLKERFKQGGLSPHEIMLRDYLALMYRNSNKGIKGRGKDRKIAGGQQRKMSSSTTPLQQMPPLPQQQLPLPDGFGMMPNDFYMGADMLGHLPSLPMPQ